MDEFNDKSKLINNDFEKNSISEGFNSINKLQNQSTSMYKVNIAAALHDHISCTKLVQPNLTNTDGIITLSLPKEDELNLMSGINSQDDTFKDIILVQLDLIQHQQEQLLKKERQLQQARQDSESLYKRLESMQKEINNLKDQLLKKEENRLRNKKSDHYLEINKDDCLDSQLTFTNFLSELSTDQQNLILKNDETDQQLNVKNTIESISGNKKIEDKKRKKSSLTKVDSEITKDDKKATSSKRKKTKDKLINDIKETINQEDQSQPKQIYQLPIKAIETDNEYEIVTNKDFFNSLDDDNELDLDRNDVSQTKSNQQSNIEIPSFRLNPISTTYSLEGTENLNDDVFSRRHSKLELDEKRRKRWDIQRLRQDNYNERLRSRYSSNSKTIVNNNLNSSSTLNLSSQNANSSDNSNDVSSFYPSPNILKYIEISDAIPVVAFGQTIPELPVTNFSLPWNSKTTNKLIKVTNKKN